MSASATLDRLRTAALRRRSLVRALWIPVLLLAVAPAAWRAGGTTGVIATIVALVLLGIALEVFDRRRVDARWVARRLDGDPRFDDSAELLWRDDAALNTLATLQKQRIADALEREAPDIRAPIPVRGLVAAFVVALVLALATLAMPRSLAGLFDAAQDSAPGSAKTATSQLTAVRVDVAPPAYTGLAPRSEASLDLHVPEGATLAWHLAFDTSPAAVTLEFHDGTRLPLARDNGEWTGTRALVQSALVRVALDGAPPLAPDKLHRVDVTPDRAPEVRVTAPDKTLTMLANGQKTWDLAFEGSDDYGLGDAKLAITLAQGTGENITFKEQSIVLAGEGDARQRRYRHTLDLAALGIQAGDDVIVRLSLADNRAPEPNVTRSASFILRWPPEASQESAGMDGLVQNALPAYFRSQRQIIIDTEALVAAKPQLEESAFVEKSDSIGVDQKILRLRYGQFLGEEFEAHAGAKSEAAGHDEHDEKEHDKTATQSDALSHNENEEHASNAPAAKFGSDADIMAEYGHMHDHAEAATLLDPETRALLKSALDEMWQAERELRTGKPDAALPNEYKALEYIKQVQQATRIYLARVGLELPAVDETRRLSGVRKDVTDPADALAQAAPDAAPVAALAKALADGAVPDWPSFDAWLAQHGASLADELAVRAAADEVRRDAACAECRERLRGLLWNALPTPAAAPAVRPAPDATGRAYLDALREVRP